MNSWTEIARRGELTITVTTRQRAKQNGRLTLHAEAAFIAELHPDGGNCVDVNFLSLEDLRAFVREMQPRVIVVACSPAEDRWTLQAQLELAASSALH